LGSLKISISRRARVRDLPRDLRQTTLRVRADLVCDRDVSTLDVDLHRRLHSVGVFWRSTRCYAGARRMSIAFDKMRSA